MLVSVFALVVILFSVAVSIAWKAQNKIDRRISEEKKRLTSTEAWYEQEN